MGCIKRFRGRTFVYYRTEVQQVPRVTIKAKVWGGILLEISDDIVIGKCSNRLSPFDCNPCRHSDFSSSSN